LPTWATDDSLHASCTAYIEGTVLGCAATFFCPFPLQELRHCSARRWNNFRVFQHFRLAFCSKLG
jgi:hypothetical protein